MDYLIPRLLSAVLSGMILSQTGSLIQISTRNILASPSTLGFDGLSVFFILILHSLMLAFRFDSSSVVFISGIALFICIGLFFARFFLHYQKIEKLILIGLTFNLLVGALFSLWQFLFLAFNLPFPVELWFGHFRYADWHSVIILFLIELFIVLGWAVLRKDFLLFTLGNTVVRNLGLNQNKLFYFIFISIAVGTFAVIHLFGAFSFLGLLFPIMARKLWFKNYDLPGEFLAGGLINGLALMAVDGLCYFFPVFGAEIPVGLIATAVGAVSLIVLLWKADNRL